MTKLRLYYFIFTFCFLLNFQSLLGSKFSLNRTQSSEVAQKFRNRARSSDTARLLLYNKGGSVRLACGYLGPIFIPKYQNINQLVNWSVGFNLPTLASDYAAKLKGNIDFQRVRSLVNESDDTRKRFYSFLENQLESWGRNGRDCLLRTICEVAESSIRHNGLIGELIHVFFTPGDNELLNEDYKAAKRAGSLGADCSELFNSCPFGHGVLDKYSIVGLFTPKNFMSTIEKMHL